MKNLLLVVYLVLSATPAFSQVPMHKQIPYKEPLANSISLIKADRDGHVLLAGVVDASNTPLIQKVGLDGIVKWRYLITKKESKQDRASRIADVFHSEKNEYVVCLNRFGERRLSGSFAEILMLDSNGEDSKTYPIEPDSNPTNGNLFVQKCWEHKSQTMILGSIFGGADYDRKKNPGSVYWFQKLGADRRQVLGRFISSTLRFRSEFLDFLQINDDIFAIASNGTDSELLRINILSGDFAKVHILGVAHLFHGSDELRLLVRKLDAIEVQVFNKNLSMIEKKELNLAIKSKPIAAFLTEDGSVTVLDHEFIGNESRISMQVIDQSYRIGKRTVLGEWSPPAVFSRASAYLANNEIILQFSQQNNKQDLNFSNNLFAIKIRNKYQN